MSKEKQHQAVEHRDAARQRAAKARARASRQDDTSVARTHKRSADAHEAAAGAAEHLRRLDVAIEGDRLGEDDEDAA